MDSLSPFSYTHGAPPPEYKCRQCGASGVRLYRDYQTFLEHIELLCTRCVEGDKHKVDPEHPDTIGGMVAAVPTEDGSTFGGFSSVPTPGVKWWRALPVVVE